MPLWLSTLCILLFSAAGAWLTKSFHPAAPTLYLTQAPKSEWEVDVAEVLEWTEDFQWIDARASSEYEKGHLKSAISLNEVNFEDSIFKFFTELQDQRPIIVYCDQAKCQASKTISEKLRELGMPRVYILRGGWSYLKNVNNPRWPVVQGQSPDGS